MLRKAVTGLRRATRVNSQQRKVSRPRPVQAPTRGWNARDSIADMKPGDAVVLDNWFPTASDVQLRKGSAAHVTGLTGQVESLAGYKPESGTEKLFAFANNSIYDVSTAGAVGSAAVSSLSSNRWRTETVVTSGGSFLLCVNGADNLQRYDGTNWLAITGASSPAITGVGTDDLINLNVFKERVFYIEGGTLSAWYTAAGEITGALTELPLQAVFKEGGSLVSMGSWSLDGGNGIDDYAVFITTEGEVAVYQGTNPGSSTTWALVGVYKIGKPIGLDCMQKLGGDLLIITSDGVLPVSKALVRGRSDDSIAMTDRIQGAMAESVGLYRAEFGWQLTHFPEGNMLLLNVPDTTGQKQYVMNTYTRAWARFTGWNAICFAEFNGGLYFGGSTVVDKAWTGPSDKGMAVCCTLVEAFNYLGDRSYLKELKMMRPTFSWDFAPDLLLVGANVDYNIKTPTSRITQSESSGDVWDTGVWDTSIWGGSSAIKNNWYSAQGLGYAVATHIVVENTVAEKFAYLANVYLYERGAVL